MNILLSCAYLLLLTEAVPPAQSEALALRQRRAIQRIDIVYTTVESALHRGETVTALIHTWSDGEQLRRDRTLTNVPAEPALVAARSIRCRNCERMGWGIDATALPNFGVEFAPLTDKNFSGPGMKIANPRVFGYIPELLVATGDNRIDQFVGAGGRSNVRTRPETLDGVECVRIDSDGPGDFTDSVWLAPSLGHTAMKARRETNEKNGTRTAWTVVSSDVRKVGDSGLYYPYKIIWEQGPTSGKLNYRNEVDVKSVTINEPIPPETFKLGGLGLPDGFYVSVPERGKSGYFRNGVIETSKRSRQPAAPAGPPVAVDADGVPLASNGRLWAAAAGVFAVLAVSVAVYRLRTVRRK